MNESTRVQSVRNAWTNALRAEVLRVNSHDLARVATVGMWIATFSDADGNNAFPNRQTLAILAGCSQETVTRAVRVLTVAGMLARRRRPNASSVYQLLMPLGRPDWEEHLHLFTETRQRSWRAKKKRRAVVDDTSRTASPDAFRTASPLNVPDSVPGRLPDDPDSVRGRPRTASGDAFRTASVDAPTSTHLPTVGTPSHDQEMADLPPQPQVGDTAEGETEITPEPTGLEAFRASRARTRGRRSTHLDSA